MFENVYLITNSIYIDKNKYRNSKMSIDISDAKKYDLKNNNENNFERWFMGYLCYVLF